MYSWIIFLNSYFSIENINFSLHINIFLNHFSDRQLQIKRRNSIFLHNHAYHQTSFYTMYHITHNQGPEFSWLTDQIILKALPNFSVKFLHEKLILAWYITSRTHYITKCCYLVTKTMCLIFFIVWYLRMSFLYLHWNFQIYR